MSTVTEKVVIIGGTSCADNATCDMGLSSVQPAQLACKWCGARRFFTIGRGVMCALCGRFARWIA